MRRSWAWVGVLVGWLGVAALGCGESARAEVRLPRRYEERVRGALTLEQSLVKARADKYRTLLHQLYVPDDLLTYTDFRDYGTYPATSYAGYNNLPAGYWVYVYPYWYLWQDSRLDPQPVEPYSPGQVVGPPDTPAFGAAPTTWSPAAAEERGEDWLVLEYDALLLPLSVVVHETAHPGAVRRITAFRLDGSEEEVGSGKDPTAEDRPHGISRLPSEIDFLTNRIKVYFQPRPATGRMAVDAVGLVDPAGKTHWATGAASGGS